MRLTVPMAMTDAAVLSTNLAEDGAVSAYSSGTTYASGDYVYLASTHKRYRSVQGSNTGHNPATDDGTWWVEYSWTNRWKALAHDTASATVADDATGIEYEIEADAAYTDLGFLGLKAASVQVVVKNASAVTVHDETQTCTEALGGTTWFRTYLIFRDLPIEAGFTIEITVADTGIAGTLSEVAKIALGKTYALGDVAVGDTSNSFQDFSSKVQDEFGDWDVTERGYADVISFEVSHPTNRTRWLKAILIANRVTPCLYWVENSATSDIDMMDTGLFVFGYADEPETVVEHGVSTTKFDVIGLSFDPSAAATYAVLDQTPPQALGESDWALASGGVVSLDVTISMISETATDIEYQIKESSSETWGTETSSGGVVSFSITGLEPETEYDVRLIPVNAIGDGDASDIKTATTDAITSSALVSDVVATLASDTAFTSGDQTITWSAEVVDNAWGWSPSNSIFTVPSGVDYVVINAAARCSGGSGDFQLKLYVNGTAVAVSTQDTQSNGHVSDIYHVGAVSPGDEIHLAVWSDDASWNMLAGSEMTFVGIAGYAS